MFISENETHLLPTSFGIGNIFKIFPSVFGDAIYDFVEKDANHKYVTPIETHWLDEHIRAGRRTYAERGIAK